MNDGSMTDTRNTQSAPPGRSLRRSREQRILAGVAGGLGEHLGINAWWLRWAFIFLAFAGGAGVLLYIVAWVFVPEPDQDETAVSHWLSNLDLSDTGTVIGVVLIGAATLVAATSVFDISGTMVTAAVLFAVGLLLYRGGLMPPPKSSGDNNPDGQGGTDIQSSNAPTAHIAADEAPSTDTVEGASLVASKAVADDATVPPAAPRPPKPPKEPSLLGRLTLAVGLIVVSTMALLDASGLAVGSIDAGEWFDPIHYVIAAMFVIAGGLIVGAWIGRARWLVVIGLMLVPVLFFTALWPSSFDWSVGDVEYQPQTVAEVADSYRLGAGSMTINLTDLTAEELAQVGSIDISLGVGEVVVRIPSDIGVDLTADVAMGEISFPGPSQDGIGIDVEAFFGPASPTIAIDIEAGAGSVVIRQIERISS